MKNIESEHDAQSTPPLTALVIEDDDGVVEFIKLGLRYENFHVESADQGEEGIDLAQRLNPDIIILDLRLPDGIDGMEVCRRLRENPTTQAIPILMLTALSDSSDKIAGLNIGADDYLAKPFNFDELVARIRAILRRRQRSIQGDNGQPFNQPLVFGDIVMDQTTREVTVSGRPITLTTTEFNLLRLFLTHPNHVLDRQTILNRVWGYDFMGETNIIEVYVRYLREKIEETPSSPRYIQTVRGIGYILKK
jgi:two-component system, OmpR family, response regulator MprA